MFTLFTALTSRSSEGLYVVVYPSDWTKEADWTHDKKSLVIDLPMANKNLLIKLQ